MITETETETETETITETDMEFQFAHKTFIFPKEAILCYKWLACMFLSLIHI